MDSPQAGIANGMPAQEATSLGPVGSPEGDNFSGIPAAGPHMLPWPGNGFIGDDRPSNPKSENGNFRQTNERFWAAADYSMSWMQSERAAGALATTGFIGDANAGALGQPGTAVVYGNKATDFGMFSGVAQKPVSSWTTTTSSPLRELVNTYSPTMNASRWPRTAAAIP